VVGPGQGLIASATTSMGGLGGVAASNLSLNVCYAGTDGLVVSDGSSRCSVLLIGQQYRLIVVVCVAIFVDYTISAY
jgi:hypothetical protein